MPSKNDTPLPPGTEHEVTRSNVVKRNVYKGHPIDTPLVKAWAADGGSHSKKSVYMAEEVLAPLVLVVVLAITSSIVVMWIHL